MDFSQEYGPYAPPDASPSYHHYMNEAGKSMQTVHPVIRASAWEPISHYYLEWERGFKELTQNSYNQHDTEFLVERLTSRRDEEVGKIIQEAREFNEREGDNIKQDLAQERQDEFMAQKIRNMALQRQRMRQRDHDRGR